MRLTASQSEEDSDNIFVAMRYGEDGLFLRRNLSNVAGNMASTPLASRKPPFLSINK
jgi:hypothetical protein